jgi:uroporphyrinogen-III synthase
VKTTLYLGTDPTQFARQRGEEGHLIHYPIIKIVPRALDRPDIIQAFSDMDKYTHVIFTSKNAVATFVGALASFKLPVTTLQKKTILAIGQVTGRSLFAAGLPPHHIALEETQEGMVSLLQTLDFSAGYVFMPCSSLSRPVLINFFKQHRIRYRACALYDTLPQMSHPKPDLTQVDEIIFTSPSTVQAFIKIFGHVPKGKKCLAIGPITQQALKMFCPEGVW